MSDYITTCTICKKEIDTHVKAKDTLANVSITIFSPNKLAKGKGYILCENCISDFEKFMKLK